MNFFVSLMWYRPTGSSPWIVLSCPDLPLCDTVVSLYGPSHLVCCLCDFCLPCWVKVTRRHGVPGSPDLPTLLDHFVLCQSLEKCNDLVLHLRKRLGFICEVPPLSTLIVRYTQGS